MTKADAVQGLNDASLGAPAGTIESVIDAIVAMALPIHGAETIEIGAALGRVLAADVCSPSQLPVFDNSAVDGFGIGRLALDTAPCRLSLAGRVAAGRSAPSPPLGDGEAVRLLTGAPIPPGVRAVVAEEHCERSTAAIVLRRPVREGLNIRRAGEDIRVGAVAVAAGQRIDARHVALLAGIGCREVSVRSRVRVGILSSGSELVDAGAELPPGKIRNVNGPMLRALLSQSWLEVCDFGICPDDPEALTRSIGAAAGRTDVLLATGGVFGSDTDCLAMAVAGLGGTVVHCQVAMKPGKRLLIGRVGRMLVLALPGNPTAALVSFLLFGRPLLARTAGLVAIFQPECTAITAERLPHAAGRTEFTFVRVCGRAGDGSPLVEPMGRGSSHVSRLAEADGLAQLPASEGDIPVGSRVAVLLFRPSLL